MEQNIDTLIIASYKWSEDSWIRRLFLHFEAKNINYFAINSLDQAKKYLNECIPATIIISNNLAENINSSEDEKNLGLKFYEELKNNPKYTSTQIIIQSFSQYNNEIIKLREIDFYYSQKTTFNELDRFMKKHANQTITNP